LGVPPFLARRKGGDPKRPRAIFLLKQENQRREQVHSQRVTFFMVKKLLARYLIPEE